MYRLIGDNHTLSGLPFSAQVFVRALDRVRRSLADDAGVSLIESQALGRIAEESAIEVPALAQHLGASADVTESIIAALIERALAVRVPTSGDPADVLELTPAGHELMHKVYLDFQSSILGAADSLDEERLFAFDSALLKMARKLDSIAEGAH